MSDHVFTHGQDRFWGIIRMVAGSCSPEDAAELASLVQTGGVDLHARAACGRGALEMAISYGNMAAVRMLVDLGVELNARGCLGDTMLETAVIESTWMVPELLKMGADPRVANSHGRTALEVAQQWKKEGIVAMLAAQAAGLAAQEAISGFAPGSRLEVCR